MAKSMARGGQSAEERAVAHVVPPWIIKAQQHVLLPALLLAEAWLLGDMMVRGLVADIQSPSSWGWLNGTGVVLFFLCGALCGAVALMCSAKMAISFSNGRIGMGSVNLFGALVFTLMDVWASLSQRSEHLAPTPADNAVLSLIHVTTFPISPTLVCVSLMLPFAIFFIGFAQQAPVQETEEERHARLQAKLEEDRFRQQRAEIWGSMGGSLLNAGVKSLLGRNKADSPGEDGAISSGNDDPNGGPGGGHLTGQMATGTDGISPSIKGGSRGKSAGLHAVPGIPKNMIDKNGLVAWVLENLGVEITPEQALALIKTIPGYGAQEGVRGGPIVASKSVVLQRAKSLWGSAPTGAATNA